MQKHADPDPEYCVEVWSRPGLRQNVLSCLPLYTTVSYFPKFGPLYRLRFRALQGVLTYLKYLATIMFSPNLGHQSLSEILVASPVAEIFYGPARVDPLKTSSNRKSILQTRW